MHPRARRFDDMGRSRGFEDACGGDNEHPDRCGREAKKSIHLVEKPNTTPNPIILTPLDCRVFILRFYGKAAYRAHTSRPSNFQNTVSGFVYLFTSTAQRPATAL